ncbi:MAG: SufD family Fe-S cluster assembly protein [Oligoflexales bacterium]|nr:SufD family Fe-S cluster assembly protein [Oligoflexales bacterium]
MSIQDLQNMAELHEQQEKNLAPRRDWISLYKEKARELLYAHGYPSRKDEDWKQTSLSQLKNMSFAAAEFSLKKELPQLSLSGNEHTLVFLDGYFYQELSSPIVETESMFIGPLSHALQGYQHKLKSFLEEGQETSKGHAFTRLNDSFLREGVFAYMGPQQTFSKIVKILYLSSDSNLSTAKNRAFFPRNIYLLDEGSSLRISEHYEMLPPQKIKSKEQIKNKDQVGLSPYFTSALSQIKLSPLAQCHWARVQNEHPSSLYISELKVEQASESTFHGFHACLGATSSRESIHIKLAGEGAESSLQGIAHSDPKKTSTDEDQSQKHVFHFHIEHAASHTQSEQLFKTMAGDGGQCYFQGKIQVRDQIKKIKAHQLNKNLLLHKAGVVGSSPQLEIDSDDVKCSHGSTVGQLREEEIHYLRSRGISQEKAISMLSHAFIQDTLSRFPDDEMRLLITKKVEEQVGPL